MIRIRQLKIDVKNYSFDKLHEIAEKKLKTKINELHIIKQSIDARNKSEIFYVFEVNAKVSDESIVKKLNNPDIFVSPSLEYTFNEYGIDTLESPILVVGSGPAGLFCTYNLLKNGYPVILIERGDDIDTRTKNVNNFIENNILDTESNVQYGLGGAGTFSDGKLNTLVKDEANRGRYVFNTFIECGANEDILYNFHPHIGTDLLRIVIKNLAKKIEELGGEIRFRTKLTNIITSNSEIVGAEVNNSEVINTRNIVLAIGNSARDTFEMLYNNKIEMEAKPIAVGVRTIHKQDMINKSQYGEYANILPPATYKLTYQTSQSRGVYSFCMCPGGYVINSSSEDEMIVVNGMSYNKRDGENSNSAIVVTVSPKDYGCSILSGIEYQRNLERSAYKLGKGCVPIQLLKDFKDNVETTKLGNINPTIMGSYKLTNLNEILPNYISDSLKEAFENFGTKIKGFDNDDVILAGVETRTSSPIRISRNNELVCNINGLYPCGEGPGYSGGITTSAIDGIKVSEAIMRKYKQTK